MNKRNFLYALSAGMMLFTACSNEQVVPSGNDSYAEKQIISLSVANDNDVTRAGRPLTNSTATQKIENVKIILTDASDNIVWTKEISDWNATGSTTYANGRRTEFEIPKTGENSYTIVKDAQYHLYALGYHNGSEYSEVADIEALKAGNGAKFNDDQVLTFTGTTYKAEEIFAGSKDFKGGDNNNKLSLVLNRQVAGVFTYVEEIPFVEGAEYLNVYAVKSASALVLGNFANEDHANNVANGKGLDFYVANAADAQEAKTLLYSIDLKNWFSKFEEKKEINENGDESITGIIDPANWKKENAKKYKTGSVFGGTFVVPFTKTKNPTLVLELSTKPDATVEAARTWTIILPSASHQLKAYNFSKWVANTSDGSWSKNESVTDDTKCYSILRNHLYGLGKRNTDYDYPDPENPTPDPDDNPDDDPTPINNKQELELRVNSNWEAVYEMGIE